LLTQIAAACAKLCEECAQVCDRFAKDRDMAVCAQLCALVRERVSKSSPRAAPSNSWCKFPPDRARHFLRGSSSPSSGLR
jgi:hypothetical protein